MFFFIYIFLRRNLFSALTFKQWFKNSLSLFFIFYIVAHYKKKNNNKKSANVQGDTLYFKVLVRVMYFPLITTLKVVKNLNTDLNSN